LAGKLDIPASRNRPQEQEAKTFPTQVQNPCALQERRPKHIHSLDDQLEAFVVPWEHPSINAHTHLLSSELVFLPENRFVIGNFFANSKSHGWSV
jgi:hypothetical protein